MHRCFVNHLSERESQFPVALLSIGSVVSGLVV